MSDELGVLHHTREQKPEGFVEVLVWSPRSGFCVAGNSPINNCWVVRGGQIKYEFFPLWWPLPMATSDMVSREELLAELRAR